jgi:beta-ureidopropionase / N-carbamoyl-L-amino-acid hydrolase
VSVEALFGDLAPIGRDAGTSGYRRFAWTDVDFALREWFAAECARRGLDLTVDRAGNQWAWWGDPDAAVAAGRPGVVTGSHLDSVPDGGAFDGPLGVVSALSAIDALQVSGFVPARPIGVVNFLDEEGARFGVACAGSRLITGALDPDRARALRDGYGVTMAEAMTTGRHHAGQLVDHPIDHLVDHLGRDDETLRRIGTFVELHVEQGRALAELDRSVALGSSIWPHGRWRFDLVGEANHAGTTRLVDRHDPMLALATLINGARSSAEQCHAVATVGKVLVLPNGVNAIPSSVTAWLDARGVDAERVRELVRNVSSSVGVDAVEESFTQNTPFDAVLAQRLSQLLGDAPVLGTGAGHDAGVLSAAGVPTAMLFVRNPSGVSHSPSEYAELADCQAGVEALTAVLAELTGEASLSSTASQ